MLTACCLVIFSSNEDGFSFDPIKDEIKNADIRNDFGILKSQLNPMKVGESTSPEISFLQTFLYLLHIASELKSIIARVCLELVDHHHHHHHRF